MEEFKQLQLLIKLLKEKKLKVDFPLSFASKPRSKIEYLFQAIGNGQFEDDNQASKSLYGTTPSNTSYKMLKRRLFQKAINQLFLVDFSNKNTPTETKAYFELLTQFLAIKLLMNSSNNYLAVHLFNKNIKVAEKFRFSDIGFLLTSILIGYINEYSLFDNNDPRLVNLYKKNKLFYEATKTELKIYELFSEVVGAASKGSTSNKNKIISGYHELVKLTPKINQVSTIRGIEYYYALAVSNIYFKKFQQAIENCETGIKKFKNTKITAINSLFLLKAQCHNHLHETIKAKKTMYEGEKSKTNPNSNIFTSFDINFQIEARSGNFANLPSLFFQATTHPRFRFTAGLAQESWHQYGLLLLFLIQLDKIPPSESLDKVRPKLRLGKLLNELQEYSKDKSGQNLSIRILHAMILLVSKRYEEFEESLPPLQAYIQRYIRKYPELSRSGMLVKMLSQIPAVGYDAERAAWRAKPLLEKMTVPPEQLPLKITEMEVIPYEKMWQFVVEFLHTIKKRPSAKKRDA
jgi:hypothetical protein